MNLLRIILIVLFCAQVNAANVRLYLRGMDGSVDTNALLVTKISTNILADGGVLVQGIPRRLAYSPITNTLSIGRYSVSNLNLRSWVVIEVGDSTSALYDLTNLLVSGANTYVMRSVNLNELTNMPGMLETITNIASSAGIGTAVTGAGVAITTTNGGVVTVNVPTQAVVSAVAPGYQTNYNAIATNQVIRAKGAPSTKALDVYDIAGLNQFYVDDEGLHAPLLTNTTGDGYLIGISTSPDGKLARFIGPISNDTTGNAATATKATTATTATNSPDGSRLVSESTVPNMLRSGTNRFGGDGSGLSNLFTSFKSIRDLGGVGDMITLTNFSIAGGSATLIATNGAFVAGDVGKSIAVIWAVNSETNLVTTIATVNNATNVTLTAAATRGVTNSLVYYGTDNTAAIQAGLTAQVAIEFPNGHYLVSGDFQPVPGTSGFAQLLVPVSKFNETNTTVRLFGGTIPHPTVGWQTNQPLYKGGAFIVSARTPPGATAGDYTMLGVPRQTSDAWGFAYCRVNIEKLSFRTYPSSKLSPLNFAFLAQASLQHVWIDTGISAWDMTAYTTHPEVPGLYMPRGNNNIGNLLFNVNVHGYGSGLVLGECTTADMIGAFFCPVGFRFPGGYHPLNIGYSMTIGVRTGVLATIDFPANQQKLNWDCYEYEYVTSKSWATNHYTIHDTASMLRGSLKYGGVSEGGGEDYITLPSGSATNLYYQSMYAGSIYGPFISIDNLAADPTLACVWIKRYGQLGTGTWVIGQQSATHLYLNAPSGSGKIYGMQNASTFLFEQDTTGYKLRSGDYYGQGRGLTNALSALRLTLLTNGVGSVTPNVTLSLTNGDGSVYEVAGRRILP